jgi:hypothetical protein
MGAKRSPAAGGRPTQNVITLRLAQAGDLATDGTFALHWRPGVRHPWQMVFAWGQFEVSMRVLMSYRRLSGFFFREFFVTLAPMKQRDWHSVLFWAITEYRGGRP